MFRECPSPEARRGERAGRVCFGKSLELIACERPSGRIRTLPHSRRVARDFNERAFPMAEERWSLGVPTAFLASPPAVDKQECQFSRKQPPVATRARGALSFIFPSFPSNGAQVWIRLIWTTKKRREGFLRSAEVLARPGVNLVRVHHEFFPLVAPVSGPVHLR